MASHLLLSALLAACLFSGLEARMLSNGPARQLLASGWTECPKGCKPTDSDGSGVCAFDSTSGSYTCNSCVGNLYVLSDGRCGCPAGKYVSAAWTCDDCPRNSYCPVVDNGAYVDASTPGATACGTNLVTLGKRSTSQKACVNIPGYSFSDDNAGNIAATICSANFYSPGYKKQKSCVPCPSGFITAAQGSTSAAQCIVPPGYFLKSPGQVAPCPRGEYMPAANALNAPAACLKCPEGVTTAAVQQSTADSCKVLKAGYYTDTFTTYITVAKKCPQKKYCTGSGGAEVTGAADYPATQCPYQTWTKNIGAASLDECMTPPGYSTSKVSNAGAGDTTQCGSGYYRAEWAPIPTADTTPCNYCGDGILTDTTPTDGTVTLYNADGSVASTVAVSTSSGGCYVKKGWGVYYNAANKQFTAVACNADNYGAAAKTYGLTANPCRNCPLNMKADQATYSSSLAYWDAVTLGYYDVQACTTQPGYGYNGRASYLCPVGTYNGGNNLQDCTPCAAGLTTAAAGKSIVGDCKLAPGTGYRNTIIQQCPIGSYAEGYNAPTTDCLQCTALNGGASAGLTTAQVGTTSSTECSVCVGGYAGTNCNTQCGGTGASASYGLAGSTAGPACTTCPAITTGFSFDYKGTTDLYTPVAVARTGADSAGDCVTQFAQLDDIAWYLPVSGGTTAVPAATTISLCAAACDTTCMMAQFTYTGAAGTTTGTCATVTASAGTDVVAMKALSYAETAASSVRANKTAAAAPRKMAKAPATKVKAKAVGMGSYTFWKTVDSTSILSAAASAGKPGMQTDISGVSNTVALCLSVCDGDAKCAGVVMAGVIVDTTSTVTKCQLIYGDSTINTWMRTLVQAVPGQLTLA